MTAERPAVLQLEGITKAYPGIVANDGISLDLRHGEIHTVLGENGAGKTTLMGIVYGLHRPDAGQILIEGREVNIRTPRDALGLGIGYVQQHFSLIPTLTVAENLVLALRGGGVRAGIREGASRVRDLSERFGFEVEPQAVVGELSVGHQQRAELLKALAREVRILVLDEPSSVLTPQESAELLAILRRLADSGVGVILVSHKLEEVLRVSDRITVLRRGRVVGTVDASQSSRNRLAEMMVGELRPSVAAGAAPRPERGTALLEVVDLWVGSDRGGHAVQGVTFSAHRGEILGIAGVEGSGQVELTEALAGLRVPDRGGILIEGNRIARHNVRAFQRAGVAHVPADRLGTGLVADLSVAESLLLPQLADPAFSRFGLLRPREMRARATALVERFDVRTAGIDVRVGSLSGGNQQKVILARELSASPRIVVCCYPTRGLDFAATLGVQGEIVRLRESGAAVLYATVDLDELLAVSDRILVLAHGRIAGELPVGEASAERLGLLMGGAAA